MLFSRLLAEYTSSQARLFATLSTAPLNRSSYNTPNVPVQLDTTTKSKITSITPSLCLDPQVIQPDYTPSYHQRSMAGSSDTLLSSAYRFTHARLCDFLMISAHILLHEPHAKPDGGNCPSARKTLIASRAIVNLMYTLTATNYDVTLLDLQPFVRFPPF